MFGDDRRVLVTGGKHVPSVEREAERRHMGAELLHGRFGRRAGPLSAELRIRYVTLVTVRESEVHAALPRDIELVARHIVAEHVATVICEPQLVRARVPIEADAVAHALGEHFKA